MLVNLLPEQVNEFWPLLRDHIQDSLPPLADYGPYDLNNILYGLYVGAMQLWLVQDEERKLKGFLTTTIMQDITGVKTLLVYNAVAFTNGSVDSWAEGYDTLVKFGKSRGCTKIAALVDNAKVLAVLKQKGADTKCIYVNHTI